MKSHVPSPIRPLLLKLVLFTACYMALIFPFSSYMQSKPFFEKLGYLPRVSIVQFVSADQKELTAALLVMKVMMYYGGLMESENAKFKLPPDYPSMSRVLHTALKLDPYNMDAYYFAQATLVWDSGAYRIANDLLVYGMKYRTWDWYLPFFAGFNSAYFLKEYDNAAKYYQKAAELSGEPLFATLAGRYMQKSGQTELAIAYITAMIKSAKNPSIRKSYQTRLKAFQAVHSIEMARDSYFKATDKLPHSVEELVRTGYLSTVPVDPYGGSFYIDAEGKVSTNSEFTFVKKATPGRGGE